MSRPPINNVRGALWMLAGSLSLAATALSVKFLGGDLPSPVIVFCRSIFGILFILPFLARHGVKIFATRRPQLHVLRAFAAVGNLGLGFYAVSHLPLATATSLSFTRPLFMILIAVVFLGDVVRWRRGLATVIGFGGVLIMLGPMDIALNAASLAALAAAASAAVAFSVVGKQSNEESPLTILAWFAVGVFVVSSPLAAIFWKTPQGLQWFLLASVGVFTTLANYCITRAFAIGETTAVGPVDYLQLIFASVAGYFLFAEVPTVWTALGSVVVVAATLYIILREARVKAAKTSSPPVVE